MTTHELRAQPTLVPGTRLPPTERQLAYRLYRVTMFLEELIEMVEEYFEEQDWPVDEYGYVDAPGFIWSAMMMRPDVSSAKELLEAWKERDKERTRKGADERTDLA